MDAGRGGGWMQGGSWRGAFCSEQRIQSVIIRVQDARQPAMEILATRAPEAKEALSREVVAFVQRLRGEDLFKNPGVAETIDWARCLIALDAVSITPEVVSDTLGALLKYQDDIAKITGSETARLLQEAQAQLAAE